jgi:hypothetical protein
MHRESGNVKTAQTGLPRAGIEVVQGGYLKCDSCFIRDRSIYQGPPHQLDRESPGLFNHTSQQETFLMPRKAGTRGACFVNAGMHRRCPEKLGYSVGCCEEPRCSKTVPHEKSA